MGYQQALPFSFQFPHNEEQTASPESQVLPHKSKSSPSDELLLLSFGPFLFFFTSVLSDVFHHSTVLKPPYVPQGCLAALSVPNPKEAWLLLAFPSASPELWLLPPFSNSAVTGHVLFIPHLQDLPSALTEPLWSHTVKVLHFGESMYFQPVFVDQGDLHQGL